MKSEVVKGNKIPLIMLILASLNFNSFPTFKKQVKKFEKYIIPIKAFSPNLLSKRQIKRILIDESQMLFLKQNIWASSPFKMPSQMLSKYISGTIGAKTEIKKPTSVSL